MKLRSILVCALFSLAGVWFPCLATSPAPFIKSIRPDGTNVVLVVHVPEGLRRLTLESRTRVEADEWQTRDLTWPDGRSGDFTFILPQSRDLEVMRIRGDDTTALPLPAAFYQGRREFDAISQTGGGAGRGAEDGGVIALGDAANGVPAGTFPAAGTGDVGRAVVESDIWQLSGSTLYFFNQQRGLQVIDVSNPDVPVLVGTLPLTAYGEQMYVLPGGNAPGVQFVALLANDGCRWDASQVILVKVENGQPTESSRLSVPGQIKETRLVGDALYVASYSWEEFVIEETKDPNGNVLTRSSRWESHTRISSFDLAVPAAPVAKPAVDLATNPDAIAATERFLFVATTGTVTPSGPGAPETWELAGNSGVVIFDISDPAGEVRKAGFALASGRVVDKFKMNLRGDTLAVVSQQEGWTPSEHDTKTSGWIGGQWNLETWLETFSLADPAAPQKLGSLSLIKGESVFASRFDGDRAYVVTFRRIDPLWVVDLSDASHPKIAGHLEVPGFSTYIQPMGDRLIAMGSENGSVAVSLFDVADAAKPTLVSRTSLGQWSWSEANYDEKAFKFIPEAGMILVPWNGYTENPGTGGSYFQGMQIIDFSREALVRRGHIDHAFQPRRATLIDDRILSISGTELLAVDATDRDHPVVRTALDLSPQVDRVWLSGAHLVKLRNSSAGAPPLLSVSTLAKPDVVITSLALAEGDVAGVARSGQRLHVAQWTGGGWQQETQWVTNVTITSEPQPPLLSYETNEVVKLVEQPPVVKLELVEVIIPLPPIPGDPRPPRFLTNIVWRSIEYPQPPLPVTNMVVIRHETPQAPLVKTNETVWANPVTVRVPANLTVNEVDLSGLPALSLRGKVTLDADASFDGVSLEAVWPKPDLLVWTDSRSSRYYPFYMFNDVAHLDGGVGGVSLDIAAPAARIGIIDWWWWPWWGSQTANLVALDVSAAGSPQFLSRLQLGKDQSWSDISPAFAAAGKVHFSHSVSTYIPPEKPSVTRTNADGSTYEWWDPGHWDTSYSLDVVDFSAAANPAVRPSVSFPGKLTGISHQGALLYADVTPADPTADTGALLQLQALAYDGLGASLVDTLPLSSQWLSPHLVRDDGFVVLALPGDGKEIKPSLDTWALSIDGKFTRYATTVLAAPAEDLHALGPLLIAGSAASGLRFFGTEGIPALEPLGTADGLCNLWFDWNFADGSITSGLWLPRGYLGLWHVPIGP